MISRYAGRRPPPWTPNRIAAENTMICWFDAMRGPTHNTSMDRWIDGGPMHLDVTQGTGSKQPTMRQYGRSTEGGKPSVGGDSTDDIISKTGITNNPLDGATSCHVFAVVSITSAQGYWMSFPAAAGSNGLDLQIVVVFHRKGTATLESATCNVPIDGFPRLIEAIYDDQQPTNKYQTILASTTIGDIQAGQQNGAVAGPVNLLGFGELHLCNFSNGFNSPAGTTSIHELIVFAKRVKGAERSQMLTYLRDKWGANICPYPLAGQM